MFDRFAFLDDAESSFQLKAWNPTLAYYPRKEDAKRRLGDPDSDLVDTLLGLLIREPEALLIGSVKVGKTFQALLLGYRWEEQGGSWRRSKYHARYISAATADPRKAYHQWSDALERPGMYLWIIDMLDQNLLVASTLLDLFRKRKLADHGHRILFAGRFRPLGFPVKPALRINVSKRLVELAFDKARVPPSESIIRRAADTGAGLDLALVVGRNRPEGAETLDWDNYFLATRLHDVPDAAVRSQVDAFLLDLARLRLLGLSYRPVLADPNENSFALLREHGLGQAVASDEGTRWTLVDDGFARSVIRCQGDFNLQDTLLKPLAKIVKSRPSLLVPVLHAANRRRLKHVYEFVREKWRDYRSDTGEKRLVTEFAPLAWMELAQSSAGFTSASLWTGSLDHTGSLLERLDADCSGLSALLRERLATDALATPILKTEPEQLAHLLRYLRRAQCDALSDRISNEIQASPPANYFQSPMIAHLPSLLSYLDRDFHTASKDAAQILRSKLNFRAFSELVESAALGELAHFADYLSTTENADLAGAITRLPRKNLREKIEDAPLDQIAGILRRLRDTDGDGRRARNKIGSFLTGRLIRKKIRNSKPSQFAAFFRYFGELSTAKPQAPRANAWLEGLELLDLLLPFDPIYRVRGRTLSAARALYREVTGRIHAGTISHEICPIFWASLLAFRFLKTNERDARLDEITTQLSTAQLAESLSVGSIGDTTRLLASLEGYRDGSLLKQIVSQLLLNVPLLLDRGSREGDVPWAFFLHRARGNAPAELSPLIERLCESVHPARFYSGTEYTADFLWNVWLQIGPCDAFNKLYHSRLVRAARGRLFNWRTNNELLEALRLCGAISLFPRDIVSWDAPAMHDTYLPANAEMLQLLRDIEESHHQFARILQILMGAMMLDLPHAGRTGQLALQLIRNAQRQATTEQQRIEHLSQKFESLLEWVQTDP
jgi:hypothetical protein